MYEEAVDSGGDSQLEPTVRQLLASVDVDATAVAERFDIIAADEGADGFSPLDTSIPVLRHELASIVRDVMAARLASVARVIGAFDCDAVLIAGHGGRLPVVMETLLEVLPVRPDRIITLADYRMAPWLGLTDPAGRVGDTKLLAAAGAILQCRPRAEIAGLELVLRPLDRASRHCFIGQIDDRGQIAKDAVLFFTGDAEPDAGPGRRRCTRDDH